MSQATVDSELDEKPFMAFKWKTHDQMHLIKNYFVQWIQIKQLEIQEKTDGGSDQEMTVLRERTS